MNQQFSDKENVLYEEKVTVKNKTCLVVIEKTKLVLILPEKTMKFGWEDVLGSKITGNSKVLVSSFPLVGKKRVLFLYKLVSNNPENLSKIIQKMANFGLMPDYYEPHYTKKFKVLINPISGRGLSINTWKQVSCLFEVCEVDIEYTSERGHGYNIIKSRAKQQHGCRYTTSKAPSRLGQIVQVVEE